MSKRALILWACFGTLSLSAAEGPVLFNSLADAPPPTGVDTSATKQPRFELLSAAYGPSRDAIKHPRPHPAALNESTLWLARAIYSETKIPHEQELVAWVVRNRVETQFRGRGSYEDVVLDPYQFSAFNPGASKRQFLLSLTPDVQIPAWQQALWIARYVQYADPVFRPFAIETRHFFSERSMDGRQHPYWVNRQQFVSPGLDYRVNERRFRFYKEIS
ncbi:MAG: hypothetical protein ABEL97_02245 [Salinibacter sp.]